MVSMMSPIVTQSKHPQQPHPVVLPNGSVNSEMGSGGGGGGGGGGVGGGMPRPPIAELQATSEPTSAPTGTHPNTLVSFHLSDVYHCIFPDISGILITP
jgi:hypothetical protein